MKKVIKILLALYLLSTTLLSGCYRRSLDYDYYNGTVVKVNIDWSSSTYRTEHVKLILYSEQIGNPLSYFINPSGDEIVVPFGSYQVLLYNWRSNEDIQRIKFKDEDNYKSAQAYTDFIVGSLFPEKILIQPDSLICWSSNSNIFLVSANDGCSNRNKDLELNTYPVSYVKNCNFFIPVTGLQYVANAEAVISGFSQSKTLYNADVDTTQYLMSVSMTQTTDGIKFHFSTFGFTPNIAHILTIRFRLIDDSIYEVTYDLTNGVECGIIEDLIDPITIPVVEATGSGFQDPSIGDWNEVHDNINF